MKLEVINRITNINNEELLRHVFTLLSTKETKEGSVKISSTYDTVKEQYNDVLQKLAQ